MKYKIIRDKEELTRFIHWIADGLYDKFYVTLLARKKYCPEAPNLKSKDQLKRFVTNLDRLPRKLEELEGVNWMMKDKPVPQEALAVYIHPNPRDMRKANFKLQRILLEHQELNHENYNVVQDALTALQKSPNKIYITFDIDSKDEVPDLSKILLPQCYKILETRGGYHVIINAKQATSLNRQARKINQGKQDYDPNHWPLNWYQVIQQKYVVDQVGDVMSPIPGCYQGGFVPKFI